MSTFDEHYQETSSFGEERNAAEQTFTVAINSTLVKCAKGSNLRKVLMENGLAPYHKDARFVHCRGIGTCGTCAVEVISGELSPPNRLEKLRLSVAPFKHCSNFRLACQCSVQGDVVIKKNSGFWGEKQSI
jgi:ferredoxin